MLTIFFHTENDTQTLFFKAYTLLKDTSVGAILEAVTENDCDNLFSYYLHDFLKSVHQCYHDDSTFRDMEYKVNNYKYCLSDNCSACST